MPHGSAIDGTPWGVAAHYDRQSRTIRVLLGNGLELAIPLRLAPHLAHERASDLEDIEISPAGLVLHWPKLDTDLYLPALFREVFGTSQGRWRAYWSDWPHEPSHAAQPGLQVGDRVTWRPGAPSR